VSATGRPSRDLPGRQVTAAGPIALRAGDPDGAADRGLRTRWRRSLQWRVVTLTLLLSILFATAAALLLVSRVRDGVLAQAQDQDLVESNAALLEAQRIVAAADTGADSPDGTAVIDTVVSALALRAGSPGLFDVLLLASPQLAATGAPERGTNFASPASIPPDLRTVIATDDRIAWTYTTLRLSDGSSGPGFIVGAPLLVPGLGRYELYLLHPLAEEQATLTLVASAAAGVGVLLAGAVSLLAWVTARQVVSPVRVAARAAQRLGEGDLTSRVPVHGEDDLAVLAGSFNTMADQMQAQITRLESLSQLQQRFVADVSHELRTPLTTMQMAADVIHAARGSLPPGPARSAELLGAEMDRFRALLADLLEISRFDAGAAELAASRIDLRDLVAGTADSLRGLAGAHGVILCCDGESAVVTADGRRIDRIIRNALTNAIEHAAGRPVTLTTARGPRVAAVRIRDEGVGLTDAEAARVFDRFWRGDRARVRTIGGTGLGMAIAREDARLHAGELQIAGVPGGGAVVRLLLPVRPGEQVDLMAEAPLPLLDEQGAAGAATVEGGGEPGDRGRDAQVSPGAD